MSRMAKQHVLPSRITKILRRMDKQDTRPPMCNDCCGAKATRRPWRTSAGKGNASHIKPATSPGDVVSVDQLESSIPGFIILGMKEKESELISFVPDRKFNDLRYTINSGKLHQLGWKEEMDWEEGLRTTVEWFKNHSGRFGNIEDALVAHPRIGVAPGSGVTNM